LYFPLYSPFVFSLAFSSDTWCSVVFYPNSTTLFAEGLRTLKTRRGGEAAAPSF
jgi:hypothetical protein